MSWHKKDEAPGLPPARRGGKTKASPKADAMRRARLDAPRDGDQDDAGGGAMPMMVAQRFGGGSPFKAK